MPEADIEIVNYKEGVVIYVTEKGTAYDRHRKVQRGIFLEHQDAYALGKTLLDMSATVAA